MATLAEILDNKTDDLNKDLRRAFRPLSAPVDISDTPIEALTILVNLTDRVIEQKDLLDRQKCKDKLRDQNGGPTASEPLNIAKVITQSFLTLEQMA